MHSVSTLSAAPAKASGDNRPLRPLVNAAFPLGTGWSAAPFTVHDRKVLERVYQCESYCYNRYWMNFLIINEDGTVQPAGDIPAVPSDPRLSDSDGDFESLYAEARESGTSSPGSDYVHIQNSDLLDSTLKGDASNATSHLSEESYAELNDECPSSFITVTGSASQIVSDFNAVAEQYCDDIRYLNSCLTSKLQSAYQAEFESERSVTNETVIGYVSVLIGQLNQEMSKTKSYSAMYSPEVTDIFRRYDELLKKHVIDNNIEEVIQKYAKGRYYQSIGDLMSARFAARDHNLKNKDDLIVYAITAYSIALSYLKDLTIGSELTDAYLKLAVCEMKIAIDYALSFHDIYEDVIALLGNKNFGLKLAIELFSDTDNTTLFDESFLTNNQDDINYPEALDEEFNFVNDFEVHADEIWLLHETHNFLDHIMFIIGYGKPVTYNFLSAFFPYLRKGPLPSTELSVAEVFLMLVSLSIYYCQVPCDSFGYDYLYRKRMELPRIHEHSTGESDVEHAIVLPVTRHERPGPVRNLIWKALLTIGQDPEEVEASKIFNSKQLLSELIQKIKAEVNVTDTLHNGYIVSERFHLMLNWYHDADQLDRESKMLLNAHLNYLRRRVPFKPSYDAIREATKTGGVLTQRLPKLRLEWLIHPIGPSCDCVHVTSVYDIIEYFNLFAYERGSEKYNEIRAKLSPAFQEVMTDLEYKANEVPGVQFSEAFLASSKAIDKQSFNLKIQIGYRLPERLSWDRFLNAMQMPGQKLGHSKNQEEYQMLIAEMQEMSASYRAEIAQSSKARPPIVVPENPPHRVQLQKTYELFSETLKKHGEWLCEKILSIQRRKDEQMIRLYAAIHSPTFPYDELLDLAKFLKDPNTTPPPEHLEATLRMLNDPLELLASGYVVPSEVIQQTTSDYLTNLANATRISRELSKLNEGDQFRVALVLDYANGLCTEEKLAESEELIDQIFGPTVAFKPPTNQEQRDEDDVVNSANPLTPSTSTQAQTTGSSSTTPISVPTTSTAQVTTASTSKPAVSTETNKPSSDLYANSSSNDSFKKAFQQWRGISEETPEEIVATVLAPALTKSSLANYKPVMHNVTRPDPDPMDDVNPSRHGGGAFDVISADSLYTIDDDDENIDEEEYDENEYDENLDAYDTDYADDYEDHDNDVY